MGTAIEIYELVIAVVTKPNFGLFEVVVDFLIPLVLISFDYHILMLKQFQFPSVLKC